MRWKERIIWIFIVAISFSLNLVQPGYSLRGEEENSKYQHLFSSVFYYLTNLYVEGLDEKKIMLGAIRGMLAATEDPYTRFLDRDEHKEFSSAESGKKAGIGVEVTIENGIPLVIAPVEGGPAEKAGVRAGDRIISIDKQSLKNMSFGDILKLISGDVGTSVELEVLHSEEAESERILIKRALFKLDYCRGYLLSDGKIGYIRLSHFFGEDSGSMDIFRKYLIDFSKKRVRGIVIDLRNNAGGHLDMAVTLSGYFLKKGDVVVSVKGRNVSLNREYKAKGKTAVIPADMPVVVLINQGSASASEIMAGALQDHGRAKLVGKKSFGKGSVQQIVRPLPDDTAALITVQKYFTPKNRSIHGKGLLPDVEADPILPTEDDRYFYSKMLKTSFLGDFRKKHPEYGKTLKDIFLEEAKKAGYIFSENFALLLLKKSYNLIDRNIPDLETDIQLARALQEFQER